MKSMCTREENSGERILRKEDFSIFRSGYAEQVEQGFRPRNGVGALKMVPPLDWDMDPFKDRNWRFHLHAWRMLDPIWNEFYASDWVRLRAEILPWVRDWYEFHVVRDMNSAFAWYDMAVGFRAQHLALLIHLHDTGIMPLTADDSRMVERLCALHHAKLRDRHFIAMNNHGIFQIQGLRLLGIACAERSGYQGEEEYSSGMMQRLLQSQFDRFGVHVENSPDYHGLILKQLQRIRPEIFPAISREMVRIIKMAQEVLPWFTLPDGRIAALGDSEGLSVALGRGACADAVFASHLDDRVLVRDLTGSGYAVVRTAPEVTMERSSMMVVKGQALSMTHAHADHLGFILYEGGRPLFVDSGKFTYARDRWRDYFAGDTAHNVVGLRGVKMGPQHLNTRGAALSRLEVADGVVRIEGEVSRREYFTHHRLIQYRPAHSVEVLDTITAREDDAPIVYWHLATDLDAERSHGGVNIYENGAQLARIMVNDPEIKARLVHGQEAPCIQGWVSPSYGSKVAATVIEFHAPKGTTRIATTIELMPSSSRDPTTMPRRLTHGLRFNFPHRFRRDRVFLLPSGRTQRRIVVELPEGELDRIERRLRLALEAKGFRRGKRQVEGGSVRVGYSHEDGTKVITKLQGPTPADGDGTPLNATLYFAWSRQPPPRSPDLRRASATDMPKNNS